MLGLLERERGERSKEKAENWESEREEGRKE